MVLYNDAFHSTEIRIDITVESDDQTYASGTRQFSLPLGEHIEIPYSLQVPSTASQTLDLVLTTLKHGAIQFQETRRFNVIKGKAELITSKAIRFVK